MFTSPSSLAPGGSTGPQRLSKRSRRLATVAAAKKEGKSGSPSKSKSKAATEERLARLLRQYGDEEAIQRQVDEAEEYSRNKGGGATGVRPSKAMSREDRWGRPAAQATAPLEAAAAGAAAAAAGAAGDAGSSQRLPQSSDAAPAPLAPEEQGRGSQRPARRPDIEDLVFRLDSNGRMVEVWGGLGKGKPQWWALWVKLNREKQVADGLELFAKELPPLVDEETGEERERVVKVWAPRKIVKAWNPKTGKMGSRTLKYEDGGVVYLNCVMDGEIKTLLQKNINVMGYRNMENYVETNEKSKRTEVYSFPTPCSDEEIRLVQAWEQDRTPLDEDAVRAQLGLPSKVASGATDWMLDTVPGMLGLLSKEMEATLKEAAKELEEREEVEDTRRKDTAQRRDWYEGGPFPATPAGGPGQQGEGNGSSWWDGSPASPTGEGAPGAPAPFGTAAAPRGPGALLPRVAAGSGSGTGIPAEAISTEGHKAGDDHYPLTATQLRTLDNLGFRGEMPATRGEAKALIAQIKMSGRAPPQDTLAPTKSQLGYLRTLGYAGDPPYTRAEASTLIDKLKAGGAQPLPQPLDLEGPASDGQLRYLEVGDESGVGRYLGRYLMPSGDLDLEGPASDGQLRYLEVGDESGVGRYLGRYLMLSRGLDLEGPASDGQLRYLEQLGHSGAVPASRAEAAQLIDILKAQQAEHGQTAQRGDGLSLDPQGPPSEGQLRYLEQLGYVINDQGAPATRAQATELIDSLKAVQPAQQGQADFRPQGPPSEGQLRFLEQLGYIIDDQGAPATRAEATELIDSLKVAQQAQQGAGGQWEQQAEQQQQWERPPPDPQGPPSASQLRFLEQLGYVIDEQGAPATRAEADAIINSLKGLNQGPPTEGQLRYLGQLGYVIEEQGAPATRAQAAELIDSLKSRPQNPASDNQLRLLGQLALNPPSDNQLRLLGQLGYSVDEQGAPATRAEADALINSLKGSRSWDRAVLDPQSPPSEGQLRFLKQLGYAMDDQGPPATRAEADGLIDNLKASQQGQRGAGGMRGAPDPAGPPSEGQLRFLEQLGYAMDDQGPPATRAEADGLIDSLKAAQQGQRGAGGMRGAPDPAGPPSEGQLRFLEQLGYAMDDQGPPASRAEADDLIDSLKAAQRGAGGRRGAPDPAGPPSEGQLDLLAKLDYQGLPPATRAEADRLIDEIKATRPRRFDASDDRRPPSDGQLHYLQMLGHGGPQPPTRAEARELIDQLKQQSAARGIGSFATPKPDPAAPASEGQRRYLTLLGYEGAVPASRGEADALIDSLKAQQAQQGGGPLDPSRPASEGQLKYLAILGYDQPMEGMTRGQADEVIEGLKKERLGRAMGPASEGQQRLLRALGHRGAPPASRAEADQLIDALKARKAEAPAWDPQGPPSSGQLGLLAQLGYDGQEPATRAAAGQLIDQLKASQKAARQAQRAQQPWQQQWQQQREEGGLGWGWAASDSDWEPLQPQRGQQAGQADGFGWGAAAAGGETAYVSDDAGSGSDWDGSQQTVDRPATLKQLTYLQQLGYEGPLPTTRQEASDVINARKQGMQPSEGQLNFLQALGYDGPPPGTKVQADELIRGLKAAGGASSGSGPSPLRPPSEGMLRLLRALGHGGAVPATRAEAAELISQLRAAQQAEQGGGAAGAPGGTVYSNPYAPPTEGQLRYLEILGYSPDETQPATREAAGALIDALKKSSPAPAQQAQQGAGAFGAWPPSEGQLTFLASLGHQGPPPETKSQADELIKQLKAARQVQDPQGPPSPGQLSLLERLGHVGGSPSTREEAGALIQSLKAQQMGETWRRAGGSSAWEGGASSGGWYGGGGGGSDFTSGSDAEDALSYFGINPGVDLPDTLLGGGGSAQGGGPLSFDWGDATAYDSSPGRGTAGGGGSGAGGGQEGLWGASWQQQAQQGWQQEAQQGQRWQQAAQQAAQQGQRRGPPDPQGPPSDGQLRYLEQLGHRGALPATRAEADQVIDSIKAQQGWQQAAQQGQRRGPPDPQGPPSDGQLRYLEQLGHSGALPATRAEADQVIDSIKAQRGGRRKSWSGSDQTEGSSSGWYSGDTNSGGAAETAADLSWWDGGAGGSAGGSSAAGTAAGASAGNAELLSYPLLDLSSEGESGGGGDAGPAAVGEETAGAAGAAASSLQRGRSRARDGGGAAAVAAGGARLQRGTPIAVLSGEFQDFSGRVTEVVGDSVKAELQVFGRSVEVVLEAGQVQPQQ
ncbi:hypothetical protein N2152v2_002633 [Parachlorella kessleri]